MKLLLILSTLISFNVFADQNADELAAADQAIQAPTMDLEGQYQVKEEIKVEEVKQEVIVPQVKVPKRITRSEQLKNYRARLEERNKYMVERKMEQIRFKQELALARQLEQSMNQTLKAIDTIK